VLFCRVDVGCCKPIGIADGGKVGPDLLELRIPRAKVGLFFEAASHTSCSANTERKPLLGCNFRNGLLGATRRKRKKLCCDIPPEHKLIDASE
jgi:hypothetical protein